MSAELVKAHALGVGHCLATIESDLGRIMGMVMQAAIHGQPGVAEQALREIGTLHQAVLELQEEALNFRAAFRD